MQTHAKAILLSLFFILLPNTKILAQFEFRGTTVDVGGDFSVASVADFNRDGKLDIALGSNQLQVFLGNGDGTFGVPSNYLTTSPSLWVTAADVNGDGRMDIVSANFGGITVLLGNGDGTFQLPVTYATACIPEFVETGDFNRDKNLDLVVAYTGGCTYVSIFLGNGDGTFQPVPLNTTPPLGTAAVGVGDFDGDGRLDLAVAGQFGTVSDVQVFLGNGDGTFLAGKSYKVGSFPISIAVSDLRKSGKLDLAVATLFGGTTILLGNGDGTFHSGSNPDTEGADFIVASDFNGDGVPDLAVALQSSPAGVDLLIGKGDGTFSSPVLLRAGKVNFSEAVGDFNNDGKPDLLVADTFSASFITLLNTGVINFSPTTPVSYAFQTVGTTSPMQTVTLTNTVKQALTVSSAKITGPFRQTNNCGRCVAAGATCDIKFTFTPTTTGSVSGSLTLIDSASSKPQVIELSGTGTWVNLSPLKLAFAAQKIGTSSAPQTVTLRNTGGTPITVSGFQNLTHEYLETDNCTAQALAPGAACTIRVVFQPQHSGPRNSQMQVFDDGDASPQTIRMTGTGD